MKSRICGSFLLILLVAFATADTEDISEDQAIETPVAEVAEVPAEIQSKGDTGEIDYESSLRPATLKKRSISTIIKLLLGGNVPPNHPLVKQPEAKTWSLASNIVAALPGSHTGYSSFGNSGWGALSAAEQLQQLFATKAKIIPYTGQVASGLTGIAAVKGDILKQIHSLSTQVIAQAAAEAAAKAVASAAAVHAIKGTVANAVIQAPLAVKGAIKAGKANALHHLATPVIIAGNPGSGWSDYQQGYYSNQQNVYLSPEEDKNQLEQPGPPYHSASNPQVQQYQAPAYQNAYPSAAPNSNNYYSQQSAQQSQNQYQVSNAAYQQNAGAFQQTAGASQQNPAAYQQQQPKAYQTAGAYQQSSSVAQQQYQAAPQQYNLYNSYNSPSTDTPQSRQSNDQYSTLPQQQQRPRGNGGPTFSLPGGTQVQGYNPLSLETNPNPTPATNFNPSALESPPLLLTRSDNNNFDLPSDSFLSAASASVAGRNDKEPPSILSSLATLISASTSAYNAINGFQNSGTVGSTSTTSQASSTSTGSQPAGSASNPRPVFSRPQSPNPAFGQGSNVPSSGAVFPQQSQSNFNSNWQQRGQGSNQAPNSFNSGSQFGSASAQQPVLTGPIRGQNQQQHQGQVYSSATFNSAGTPFNSKPFSSNNNQFTAQASRNQFHAQSVPGASFSGQYRNGGGSVGPGYPGNNGGAGSGPGYAGRFGPQPAGSSPVQASRPPNGNGNGYPNQTPGNFNSPPRGFFSQQQQNNQFNGQTNYPNSQNNYAASNIQTQQQHPQQSAPRPYNAAPGFIPPFPAGGQTNGFSRNGNPSLNPIDYAQSGSEQIKRFELPPRSGSSQFNNNNINSNNNNMNNNNNNIKARTSLKNIKKNKKGSDPSSNISPHFVDQEGHHDQTESSSMSNIFSNSLNLNLVNNAPTRHNHDDHLSPAISVEQYDDILIAKNPEHKTQTPYAHENRWIDHPTGQRSDKLHPHHPHEWTSYSPPGEEIDIPSPKSPSINPTNPREKHRGHSESRSEYGGNKKSSIKYQSIREEDRSGATGSDGGGSEPIFPPSLYSTLPKFLFGDGGKSSGIGGRGNSQTDQDQEVLGATSGRGKDKIVVRISKAIDESSGVIIHDDNYPNQSNNPENNEEEKEKLDPENFEDDE